MEQILSFRTVRFQTGAELILTRKVKSSETFHHHSEKQRYTVDRKFPPLGFMSNAIFDIKSKGKLPVYKISLFYLFIFIFLFFFLFLFFILFYFFFSFSFFKMVRNASEDK